MLKDNISKETHTRNLDDQNLSSHSASISDEIFRSLFNQATDAILLMTVSDAPVLSDVNEATLKMHGYSKEELIGMPISFLDDPESIRKIPDRVKELKEKGSANFEAVHIRKDGTTFPVDVNAQIIKIGEEAFILSIDRDITERKKVEKERERLNKELEQVIHATSHDLRSPLVNIIGYNREIEFSLEEMETVLNDLELPADKMDKIKSIIEEDIAESMKYITSSISKMDALLSGLVKLSRSGSVEMIITECDMNRIIANILDVMEYQLVSTGAKCEVFELPACKGDESQLDQLFSNLVGNAIKCLDPERNGIIKVSGKKQKNLSVYCIEDNGIGIEHEYLSRIFDLFHKVSSDSEGEGVGLSIVKKIIDRLGGDIWIESEPGIGSKFYVSLPS